MRRATWPATFVALASVLGEVVPALAQPPHHPCAIKIEIDGGHEVVDLEHDRVIRWYGKPAPAHARVALSLAEKDTLCTILAEGRVFDLPDVFGNGSPHVKPSMAGFHFDLRMGSRSRELGWRPDWDPGARPGKPGPDPRQDFLFEFYYRLEEMLQRNRAYRTLPTGPVRL